MSCQTQQKTYVCMSDLSPKTMQQLRTEGLGFARTLNSGNNIVQIGQFAVDSVKMVRSIETIFPLGSPFKIGILDWEEGVGAIVENHADAAATQNIIAEYLKALRIAKQMRPNILWGIYSLPATRFWNRDKNWYAKIKILDKVLAAVDVFCPSLYGYYPNMKAENAAYVQENMQYALRLGAEYQKPVYVFVWHRWHDSNPTEGLKIMPWDEMAVFIETIAQTKVNGAGAAGCIWWGEDHYFYNTAPKNIRREVPSTQSFDQYHETMIRDYAQRINQRMRQKPSRQPK